MSKLKNSTFLIAKIKKISLFIRLIFNLARLNYGFTLVELLVAITLVGIIGVLVTQAFIIGLNAQAKSEVMKEVKQNGDYAISVIEQMVRNARDITGQSCNETSSLGFTIENQDGYATTFACSSENSNISSISATLEGEIISAVSLTTNKVTVTNCSFRIVCPTPPVSPKYVFVNFTISQLGESVPVRSRASQEYQTTISLRNYQ